MSCAVKNCQRRILPTNRGYRFPKNEAQRKQWLKFCRLSDTFNAKTARVCVLHFKPDDFENGMECDMGFAKKRNLKHGIVPSINTAAIKNMDLYKKREIRKEKRENKRIVAKLLQEHTLREKPLLDETKPEQTSQKENKYPQEDTSEFIDEPMFEPTTQMENKRPLEYQEPPLEPTDEEMFDSTIKVEDMQTQEDQESLLETMDEQMFEPLPKVKVDEDPLSENVLPNLNSEEISIKNLKNSIDIIRRENQALKKACDFELKAKEEQMKKLTKITKIYQHNLSVLSKRLATINNELTNLKKIKETTNNQVTKLKQKSKLK